MKSPLLKYRLVQPKKAFTLREAPHPVFLTGITADPYAGCRFGCPYCYAVRDEGDAGPPPEAAVKTNIVSQLKKKIEELLRLQKGTLHRHSIMIGGLTDPYQDAEKEMMVTKHLIEVISEAGFPFQLFTKSDGVLRDADLIARHSAKGLAAVNVTVFSLDEMLWRTFEGGAPSPEERLSIITALKKKGVLCGVVLMPVFPYVNDGERELDRIFSAAKRAGAEYVIPGCYRPLSPRSAARVSKIIKEKFSGIADRFESVYAGGTAAGAGYVSELSERIRAIAKKYELPLNIPAPGAKDAIELNIDPVA